MTGKFRSSGIIYLAGPYTHEDTRIRNYRYHSLNIAAAALIATGLIVFSPITMTHPIDSILAGQDKTLGSDYWVNFDEVFMEQCSELTVLTLDGWEDSAGVKREIAFFRHRNRAISFIALDNMKIRYLELLS